MSIRKIGFWANRITVALVLEVLRFLSRFGGSFEVVTETECCHSEKVFLYEAACSAGETVCFYQCKDCQQVIGILEGLQ